VLKVPAAQYGTTAGASQVYCKEIDGFGHRCPFNPLIYACCFFNRVKLKRNGFDFIFLTGFTGLTGFFSPSARSPFGRRPFYPDDPVNPVQLPIKDENPFLFLPYFDLRFFLQFFYDQTCRTPEVG
jgi:hypothetical protein